MSGSSNAGVSGKGWSLSLDSGISISWSDAEEGAAIHAEEERGYVVRLQALRPRLEKLLADSGLVVDDLPAARGADTEMSGVPKTPTWPLALRASAGMSPQCLLRLRVVAGSVDDVARFHAAVLPLLREATDATVSTPRLQSGPLRITVLGAGGGLGRNVVDAARAAGHPVRALVRDAKKAALPDDVDVVVGDANVAADVARACADAAAVAFCVNPPLSTWATTFPPLLDVTLAALKSSSATLLFPANVWIYGPGRGGLVDEETPPAPTSDRGRLRVAMEQKIRDSGVRARRLRLPEFYGEHVVTLTAYAIQRVLRGQRVLWPGDAAATVEFVYLRDAAQALVELAALGPDVDADLFHLPGAVTTPRAFVAEVGRIAGVAARITSVPSPILRVAGVVDDTAAAIADIAHLWSHPILLDGGRYQRLLGPPPVTPLSTALASTVAWHRAQPDLKLQG